jgi:hypothetical protein
MLASPCSSNTSERPVPKRGKDCFGSIAPFAKSRLHDRFLCSADCSITSDDARQVSYRAGRLTCPSRADEMLTSALRQALALVDHFVVAGVSFDERGLP